MKICNGVQQRLGSLGEGVEFKNARRPIPDNGFGRFHFAGKEFHAFRSTVHTFPVIRDALLLGHQLGLLFVFELFTAEPVHGQSDLTALGCSLVQHALHDISTLLVEKALADLHSKALLQEGVGHATADDNAIGFVNQILNEFDLVVDLCTANDGDQRPCRGAQDLGEGLQLLLDQQTCDLLRKVAAHHRRVGSMCCPKGIIDVDITKL
mmetsp:Transcript_60433/g.74055  ORF Transcript_60433/g.74055 Transcript_60433/m.74055 type:complete len:209 (-) Transcript_60433:547-1173(-)